MIRDAFVAQGSQCLAGGDVESRVERVIEGKRDDGDLRVRESDLERNEYAMVVAALRIGGRGQTGAVQHSTYPGGQSGIAGGGPGELVGVCGEAGVVVDELRLSGRAGGEGRFLAMPADDQQRFWLEGQRGRDGLEKTLRRMPGVGRAPSPIHEKARSATVGKEQGRLPPYYCCCQASRELRSRPDTVLRSAEMIVQTSNRCVVRMRGFKPCSRAKWPWSVLRL